MPSTIRKRLEKAWLNLPIQFKIAAVTAIPLACLWFEVVWVAGLQRSEQTAADLTLHTQSVELAADQLLSDEVDEETGVRGYLVTGQRRYLEPYTRAGAEIPGIQEKLRGLVADNPAQEARLRHIAVLVETKRGLSAQMISQNPRAAPAPLLHTQAEMTKGKQIMDELRLRIGEFVGAERSLFAARAEHLRQEWRRTDYALWAGALLGLAVAGGAVWVVGGGMRRRFLQIAADAEAFSGGLPVQAPTKARDEVGLLARQLHAAHELARERLLQFEQSELQVREQNTALREVNRELEIFSYSVSHDLRAPLRHVDGYGKLLLDDYGAEVPAEARRMLERMCAATERMGLLIDELLNLGRLNRQEVRLENTCLRELVEEVRGGLEQEASGRSIEWRIVPLSAVQCDRTLMRQVIFNLLANAVKYTRKRELAVIEIGEQEVAGERQVFVRDNGAGFDMRHADKLFGVFQRLHRQEEFEGTGVGLACAARILHRHGGRIWAEAQANAGATFYFALPAAAGAGQPQAPAPAAAEGVSA